MDWSSFWPDLIVGLATGGIVGLVVLGAERRISRRSHQQQVETAQRNVVDRARSLLQHPLRYESARDERLHLDMSQINRLREDLKAVPAGEPAEMVPGFFWVQQTVEHAEELEALTDALEGRIEDHDQRAPNAMFMANLLRKSVSEFARSTTDPGEWQWRWADEQHPVYRESVERDAELRRMTESYVSKRHELAAYREAFLTADRVWRERVHTLQISDPIDPPRGPIRRAARSIARRRTLRRARWDADEAAGAVVIRKNGIG